MNRVVCVPVVALFAVGLFASIGCAEKTTYPYDGPPFIIPQNYTSHSPIHIKGNAQFNGTNGVVGNGTQYDPYIISGWDINTQYEHGIWIENTNLFFIISNCYLHCTTPTMQKSGIYLKNVTNGVINECAYNGNINSVFFESSDYNIISNNDINTSVTNGIYLLKSNNNSISNNTFDVSFAKDSIRIEQSDNNMILKNNMLGTPGTNYNGIHIVISEQNLLDRNFIKCYQNGILIDQSSKNEIMNNSVTQNYFGFCLSSSSMNIFCNNNCSNNGNGIVTGLMTGIDGPSNSNIFMRNTLLQNGQHGVYNVAFSCYNIYKLNKIFSNAGFGIFFSTGDYCKAILNNFSDNNKGGVQANAPGGTNFFNTSNSSNNYGNYWNDWTAPDENHDGIVDNPYKISEGVYDYYPIADWSNVPETSPMPLLMILVLIIASVATRLKDRYK